MSDETTTTRWRLHDNEEPVSRRTSGWHSNGRQEGDNDTWRQKREARMAMTITMMTMTCVVRTIMAWSQRHDGEDDDSRIVTTGRWRRRLEHDVKTVITMIAGSSRQDGDDDGNWNVTTGGSQLRRECVVSLAATYWIQDQALAMKKPWIRTIPYKMASKTLYLYVLLALMRVAR